MRNFYKTRYKTKQFFSDIQSNKIQTRLKNMYSFKNCKQRNYFNVFETKINDRNEFLLKRFSAQNGLFLVRLHPYNNN